MIVDDPGISFADDACQLLRQGLALFEAGSARCRPPNSLVSVYGLVIDLK